MRGVKQHNMTVPTICLACVIYELHITVHLAG
jgi:hypothetical protein